MSQQPFFSVIIPTRNRPFLLKNAINSVLQQDYDSYEIVIVDDGSDEKYQRDLQEIVGLQAERIKMITLRRYPRGHGPSYAINSGVWVSRGSYCTFLDDDDIWLAPDHLTVAAKAIAGVNGSVDLFYANQEAVHTETHEKINLWLYGLVENLRNNKRVLVDGCYQPSKAELMNYPGFNHLNTSIVKSELFHEIGGLDEDIRYEGDFDFYLRCVDKATTILLSPRVVARHHIPAKSRQENVSTTVTNLQKLNTRLYFLNKNILSAREAVVVEKCKSVLAFTFKNIAESAEESGDIDKALYYARQALASKFSIKWLGYCLYLLVQKLAGVFK